MLRYTIRVRRIRKNKPLLFCGGPNKNVCPGHKSRRHKCLIDEIVPVTEFLRFFCRHNMFCPGHANYQNHC